jgi:hypothetical protein
MILLLGFAAQRVAGAESPKKPQPEAKPIVIALFNEGKEAVIEPNLEKLKAHGITFEQLEPLRWRRLNEGDWKIEIEGKKVDLGAVAKITVRDLAIEPFTVALPDGREALITPDARKVGRYKVTGEYFRDDVRDGLQNLFMEDPLETTVLADITIPVNHEPKLWGRGHRSLGWGNPLKDFAKVEIRGKPGPQAADLARMRMVDKHLDAGLEFVLGMPRREFEKRFGPGKKADPPSIEVSPDFEVVFEPRWYYTLGRGKLLVGFDDQGSEISLACIEHPTTPVPPENAGRVARALADTERDLLLSFLEKRFRDATAADKDRLRGFLEKTQKDLQWTQKERKQVGAE